MTDLVQQARAALEGVTPGPWHMQKDAEAGIGEGYFVSGGGFCRTDVFDPAQDRCSNARFIAASRDLVPAMADEIERLRAALAQALVACRIVDDVAKAGHETLGGMVAHFLEAIEPARAALGEDHP